MNIIEKEDTQRILNKALYSLVAKIHPNGFVVKDEVTNGNYILLIDEDTKKLIIEETSEIHPDNDCTEAVIYRIDVDAPKH